MSVAKVVEILASSPDGFDEAVRTGVERASKTLEGIKGVWVKDQQVVVENGKVTEYRVALKVTFVLND
jgi:flavin-binding protein dodecin